MRILLLDLLFFKEKKKKSPRYIHTFCYGRGRGEGRASVMHCDGEGISSKTTVTLDVMFFNPPNNASASA